MNIFIKLAIQRIQCNTRLDRTIFNKAINKLTYYRTFMYIYSVYTYIYFYQTFLSSIFSSSQLCFSIDHSTRVLRTWMSYHKLGIFSICIIYSIQIQFDIQSETCKKENISKVQRRLIKFPSPVDGEFSRDMTGTPYQAKSETTQFQCWIARQIRLKAVELILREMSLVLDRESIT